MRTLYPALEASRTFQLKVDTLHTLYVEECGHPEGLPLLFLHGGPGGGCMPSHRRYFDPKRYRIVLFDQRGCGKSTPHAELKDNTTHHLIDDIERIREHLNIDKWVVFGGSWGSTLALAYAERNPERVQALILRGIFLCRSEDIAWFYQSGADRIFPDYWRDFIAPVPHAKRNAMVSAYYELLTKKDEETRLIAAKAWSLWEARTATLLPDQEVRNHFAQARIALSMARIECHYFMHHAFLRTHQLLDEADRLQDIPGVIVHGRYDVICPLDQATALHQAWPQSVLRIIPDAGHAASEAGIVDALVAATDHFAELFA